MKYFVIALKQLHERFGDYNEPLTSRWDGEGEMTKVATLSL